MNKEFNNLLGLSERLIAGFKNDEPITSKIHLKAFEEGIKIIEDTLKLLKYEIETEEEQKKYDEIKTEFKEYVDLKKRTTNIKK